jgi:hypothetical protein
MDRIAGFKHGDLYNTKSCQGVRRLFSQYSSQTLIRVHLGAILIVLRLDRQMAPVVAMSLVRNQHSWKRPSQLVARIDIRFVACSCPRRSPGRIAHHFQFSVSVFIRLARLQGDSFTVPVARNFQRTELGFRHQGTQRQESSRMWKWYRGWNRRMIRKHHTHLTCSLSVNSKAYRRFAWFLARLYAWRPDADDIASTVKESFPYSRMSHGSARPPFLLFLFINS